MSELDLLRPDPRSVLATARESLECYCIAMCPAFESFKHHRAMIRLLEDVESGRKRRVMISMPPRHGKSLLVSQLFPAWYLGRHPDRSVIIGSYGQDLSDDFGRRTRNLLADPLHEAIFPECRLMNDSASQRRFDLTAAGSYYAVGRGGSITGRGSHLQIWDDLIKDVEEARSETVRRSLHDWYQSVAYTRLTPGGAVVIVSTRWHESDLAGWLLREHPEENWTVLSLPAIAEANDPLGRAEGEPLWESRFPLPILEQIKMAIGSAAWTSLYQQRPSAAEGQIFKREWWRFYDREPESFKRRILSVDTAFKTSQQNDYTAIQLWGEAATGFYLLLSLRERLEFPALKHKLISLDDQLHPDAIVIEDCASGQSLLQELRASTSLPLKPIVPDRDKVSRATAASALVEAGRVHLPQPHMAAWVDTFLDEVSSFPNAAHDDMVDALSHGLRYLRGNGIPGIVQFWERQAAADALKRFGTTNIPRPAVCAGNPSTGQHEADRDGKCRYCRKDC
jgi:predicted phage terminase large subunit-like protein